LGDKWQNSTTQKILAHTLGVAHCGLAIYIKKSILRQKMNYGNSNISSMQKYNPLKNPLKETKILQDIIITL
jgi:hypothetical protein